MKQFASWFTHGVPGGGALRKTIYEARTGPAILDAVERFFAHRFSGVDVAAAETAATSPFRKAEFPGRAYARSRQANAASLHPLQSGSTRSRRLDTAAPSR